MADFPGTAGDDILNGGIENDLIQGFAGNDTLIGGAGADRMDGGDGIDTVDYSGSGAGISVQLFENVANGGDAQGDNITNVENVIGSAFDDAVAGTEGNNVIMLGDGDDLVNGRGGFDTIETGAGDDTIRGSNGADLIDGGTGFDTLDYTRSGAFSITQQVNGAVVATGGLADGDRFSNVEALLGSGNNDTITAVNGLQEIFGQGGNDTLIGSDTSLLLDGGNGNDRLFAGIGAETLVGGGGTDVADYRNATEGLRLDLSNIASNTGFAAGDTYVSIENFVGSTFGDVMIGTAGDDRFFANEGNDTLIGGAGADRMDGGDGIDTVDYSGSGAGISVQLFENVANGGDAQGDNITNVENVIGSAFDDAVAGTEGDNVIMVGDGDDLVNGRGGFDTIETGAGDDTIRGSNGADLIDGGTGFDTLDYTRIGQGVVIGREGPVQGGSVTGDVFFNVEQILGTDGNDVIALQDGVVDVRGRNGHDHLTAFGGTFELHGGTGNDILEVVLGEASTAGASFFGGGDTDTLLISGVSGAEDFRDDSFSSVERLAFNTGLDQDYEVTFTADQFAGFNNVRSHTGFRGNEEITVNIDMADRVALDLDGLSLTNLSADSDTFVITGGVGEQRINGTALNDIISTGDGADLIRGRGGDDIIDGGNGNDTLQGDGGNDTIKGGDGNDAISGGAGDDLISGGEGADTIAGNDGFDTVDYSTSDAGVTANLRDNDFSGGHASGDNVTSVENIIGSDFADVLTGLNSNSVGNTIDGGRGNDVINGLAGNDVLIGGDDHDTISGGTGNDRLEGGRGRDLLEGGAGVDLIDGQQGVDTVSYESSSAGVRIDLSGQNASRFGDAQGDLIRNVENAIGSGHNDTMAGSDIANTLSGDDGNDQLNGRGGNDQLFGGQGDDTLIGGQGNDRLFGGDGDDRAVFSGQAADFDITVNRDLIVTITSATQGTDRLFDIESLSFDDQTILVDDLPRVIAGTSGADNVTGGNGDDFIRLGAGNDLADGGAGDDVISGGAGDDTLGGGSGTDLMLGGAGADTFQFSEGSGKDTIRDFEQGIDTVLLDTGLFGDVPGIDDAQDMIDAFATLNATGTYMTLNFGGGDILHLREADGFDVNTLHEDFVFL